MDMVHANTDVSASDPVAAARLLAPVLADRAREAEDLRQLPEATIDDLRRLGLFDLLVPKDLGGRQLDIPTVMHMTRELSKGCTSTGWVAGFLTVHGWIMSLLDEAGRRALFADGPTVLAPAPLAPAGTTTRAPGGYRLSGRWSWASGVMHADWVMVGAILDGHPLGLGLMAVPRSEVEVVDVWHTDGMRGTGSNDVVAEDVFVPDHLVLPFFSMLNADTAGARDLDDPLYRWPMVPVLAFVASAPALGTAEGLVERFAARITERVMAYSGDKQQDRPAARMRLAQATAIVASARALYDTTLAELDEMMHTEGTLTVERRGFARLVAAHVVHESRRAVNLVVEASGGSVHFLDSPFQRAQRDLNTLSGHVIFDYDATTELYGSLAVGLEVPITSLH